MKVSIEGNIGAGKSTLLKVLDAWFKEGTVETMTEPVDSWKNCNGQNLLDAFYSDPKRYAFAFQSYAFISRMAQMQVQPQTAPLRILERSPLSDYCFAKNCHANGLMDDVEWAAYRAWWGFFMNDNSPLSLLEPETALSEPGTDRARVSAFRSLKPHAIVYLRTTPEVCYNRMKMRSRSEEAGVPLDYLQQIHDQHEAWFPEGAAVDSHHGLPFITLDATGEFESREDLQREFVARLVTNHPVLAGRLKEGKSI